MTRLCDFCGKEFEPLTNNRRFCSDTCKENSMADRQYGAGLGQGFMDPNLQMKVPIAQPSRESQLVNDIKSLTEQQVELQQTIQELWRSLAFLITPIPIVAGDQATDSPPDLSAVRKGLYELAILQKDNISALQSLITRVQQET